MSKIVHLLSSGGYSGAEAVALNIIKSSPKEYNSIYVSPEGPIEEVLKENTISHEAIDNMTFFNVSRKMGQLNPEVIYSHDFKASILAAFIFRRKYVIAHIHQNPEWFKRINLKTILFLFATLFIKKIVFVSQETNDEFIFKKLIRHKSTVLPNYINEDEILSKAGTLDEKSYEVAFLGRFEEVKNPMLFVDIVHELQISIPEIKAVMIGDGTLFDDINDYIDQNNLSYNISLKGYLSNPYPELIKSKLLIIPSIWEGFGLSSAEAMVLGIPVIGSKVGGLQSIITDKSGFLCTTKLEFVNSARLLLEDPRKLHEYSLASQINVKRFTDAAKWETSIASILEK